MAQEEDRIDIGQAGAAARGFAGRLLRLLRDDVRVGADEGVVGARLVPEPLDHRQRMRRELVLRDAVARVGPGQHDLAGARACAPRGRGPSGARPLARPVRRVASSGQLPTMRKSHP